jgi:hypothetical protein
VIATTAAGTDKHNRLFGADEVVTFGRDRVDLATARWAGGRGINELTVRRARH